MKNRLAAVAFVAVLVALALVASGCSWAFSRPPHRVQPASATAERVYVPLCRPSYAPPVIDLWQAIGGGVLTLYALGHAGDSHYESEADTFVALGLITGGLTALYGASASYGFKQARACREQRAELARGPAPAPMWITPSQPGAPPLDTQQGIVIDHDVDVDGDQIEVRTRIRPGSPPPPPPAAR